MPDFHNINQDGITILFDAQLLPNPDKALFDPQYWRTQGLLSGGAKGRGTTYFFRYQQLDMVLRHYRRGGLIGKLLQDQYFFTGLEHTRAWQEFYLLADMQQDQLPAPVPVAALIERSGLAYRADLITLRIPASVDVFQALSERALTENQWISIGRTIRQLHDQQIFHHDLNIHNLMLDQQDKIWIIDFDKCRRKGGQKWKQQNLDRLLRSLHKEKQRQSSFYWQQSDWDGLLAGYNR
ncbi:3-deoxy-D-manno-octulosonic acid kinase [Neptunicella sp. SCSIO 80796]|uniref:3-deoxy-D-manno-octulosonic acid kinase n=1 Tax=Neptunicella plasticusilytica TaxID=3117012 RepID=UPI003A4E38EC